MTAEPQRPAKIQITDVSKAFGDVQALGKINLTLGENEFVSVVGASGCGKSTLLWIIAGLTPLSTGSVTIDGREVEGPGRDRGVVFQASTLLPWLTAEGNVRFALQDGRTPAAEQTSIAREYLELVGLKGFENAYPNQLSGGMQQRVALARSLSYQPSILLMDEPFGALDALTRRDMQELLTSVWERHRMTVMLVTHDIEEAIITSDRVVVMSPRPGSIRAELEVPLERPRRPEMTEAPESRALFTQILDMVHTRG